MELRPVQIAAQRLAQAGKVAVLTGAGISAESGVPTFRGSDGLWEKYRPEDLATPQAFARDPELVWRWYHWRRGLIAQCEPNPAHRALADLERRAGHFTLITQNVDGLHHLAGSRNLLEVHGNLWMVRCTSCGALYEERELDLPPRPACRECGGLLRPHVVWFGESLDSRILDTAWRAAAGCQVMLVVGTSAVVQPAAGLASVAKQAGAFVVEVNLETTPNSREVDLSLMGKAGEILPQLTQ
ncbi:MAG: NAD-dependent deacylase [Desulfarculaceae bacterium]|nr:NAD-dependent deacylase [Desulfarculaceae bacterium]MCF8048881.1 NAD-dependent deacylase [Desulfarculaceae bacterium]MCF8065636.1 NAD-dependent deacylase [Desulfarculaceae bacterium]MCF8099226.1 NAD-dependent deacylase [Desulfarculaceae bacterium]